MKFLSKVYLTFSFAHKFRDETRSDYIERVIAEAKEKVSFHHADILEITGSMFNSDIKVFKKILDTVPISSKPTTEPHKYAVTFIVPAEKLLKAI